MNKDVPVSNKILEKRIQGEQAEVHLTKILRAQAILKTNQQPIQFRHLANNKKKQQLQEDELTNIESANRKLLENIIGIAKRRRSVKIEKTVKLKKTLNSSYRKRELSRIMQENMNLLKRLKSQYSVYNSRNMRTVQTKSELIRHKKVLQLLVIPSTSSKYHREFCGKFINR